MSIILPSYMRVKYQQQIMSLTVVRASIIGTVLLESIINCNINYLKKEVQFESDIKTGHWTHRRGQGKNMDRYPHRDQGESQDCFDQETRQSDQSR